MRANRRTSATIRDVAKLACVSRMTVSRVINGSESVAPTTRRRVEAAIAETGYVPDAFARQLATGGAEGRSDAIVIAIVYDRDTAANLGTLMAWSIECATRAGVRLIPVPRAGAEDEALYLERLARACPDGVLFLPDASEAVLAMSLAARLEAPMVAISPGVTVDGVTVVRPDDENAARSLTDHLIAHGHRRIGLVAGAAAGFPNDARLAGYRSALAMHGLDFEERLVVDARADFHSTMREVQRLLAMAPRPTAVLACGDQPALACAAAAAGMMLHVPWDLTICAFDDGGISSMSWPNLTRSVIPAESLCGEGFRILVRQIGYRRARQHSAPIANIDIPRILCRSEADLAPAGSARVVGMPRARRMLSPAR